MRPFESEVRTFYEQGRRTFFDELYAEVNRQALAPFFRSWLDREGRVLDAGAGTGGLAGLLGLENACFLDLSWRQIKCFRNSGMAGHFIQGDVLHLPFADHTFDQVLCANVLHYTGLAGLGELVRVTRRGGRLLVAFLEDSPWTRAAIRLSVLWGWFPRCFLGARLISMDEVASLGLMVEDSSTVVGFPWFFLSSRDAVRQGLVGMILKKGVGKG